MKEEVEPCAERYGVALGEIPSSGETASDARETGEPRYDIDRLESVDGRVRMIDS